MLYSLITHSHKTACWRPAITYGTTESERHINPALKMVPVSSPVDASHKSSLANFRSFSSFFVFHAYTDTQSPKKREKNHTQPLLVPNTLSSRSSKQTNFQWFVRRSTLRLLRPLICSIHHIRCLNNRYGATGSATCGRRSQKPLSLPENQEAEVTTQNHYLFMTRKSF